MNGQVDANRVGFSREFAFKKRERVERMGETQKMGHVISAG